MVMVTEEYIKTTLTSFAISGNLVSNQQRGVDSPLDKAEEVVKERTTLFAIRSTHVPTTSSSLMVSVLVVRS